MYDRAEKRNYLKERIKAPLHRLFGIKEAMLQRSLEAGTVPTSVGRLK
jgi:hypothetical protein